MPSMLGELSGKDAKAQLESAYAILDSVPSRIVVIEAPNGRIISINQRTRELYGFDTRATAGEALV